MKKLLVTALLLMGLSTAHSFAESNVVFVDLQEVFKQFYKTQIALDQIKQQSSDIQLEQSMMQDTIQELKDEIEALRADARDQTLSAEIREGKQIQLEEVLVKLQKTENEMKEFVQLRSKQLEKQNTRMSRKLFDEINESIIAYAKKHGLDGVIDSSAQGRSGTRVCLFIQPQLDVTSDILASLNKGHESIVAPETANAEK